MKTRDIINILEKKFPKINAEEWDNVGLLIGNYNKEVKKFNSHQMQHQKALKMLFLKKWI